MYSKQIEILLKCDRATLKYFKGVFSCDNIERNKQKKYFIIVNSASSQQTGKHWLLFFRHNEQCTFFDSLGNRPTFYGNCIEKAFKEFSEESETLIFNSKKLQSSETSVCGIYCIYMATELCRNKSINTIENHFSSDYRKNDKKIEIWFRKYIKNILPIKICYKQGQFSACEKSWNK